MDISGVDPHVVAEVERESSELLGELIRVDTSNPPGDETRVATLLDAYFRRYGLEGEIVGEPPGRRSWVLRLEGRRAGPSLLLLAHEDVVPAEPREWTEPPFSGLISDGYIWGRGAVDIKNLIAVNAVAVRRLAADGLPEGGAVVFAATADEEEGSVCGARWLVDHRPDLMRCDYVLNEGGAHYVQHEGRHLYLVETGEMGVAQFKVIVKGESAHTSSPLRRGDAVRDAARVLSALGDHLSPLVIDEASRDLVALLVEDPELQRRLREPEEARVALAELARRSEDLADMIEPLYGSRFEPTIVAGNSAAVNVHPSRVEISVDCRPPAGQGRDEVEAEIRKALAGVEADWDFEWLCITEGNFSAAPSALSDAIGMVMRRLVPGAELAFSHCVGFTDSNWFRAAYPETVAYGFNPHLVDSHDDVMRRCHGKDERIHVRDLTLQVLHAELVARELLR